MKTPRLSPCGQPGRFRVTAFVAAALLVATSPLLATDYYVSPTGNDANNGTSPTTPWRTIKTANAVVQPGDTVYLRGGEYESPTAPPDNSIIPAQSGTSTAPITYTAYGDETPVFTNIVSNKYAFDLDGKSWIIIDGITVDGKQLNLNANVSQWGRIINGAHDNIVRNSTFRYGKGSIGIFLDGGAYRNKLLNNVFDLFGDWDDPTLGDKGETVNLRDTTHNLIEGNLFKHPGHNSLALSYSAQFNVVRNNVFDGDWSDEYPVRSTGTAGNRSVVVGNKNPPGTTLRNVFEHNVVRRTGSAVDALYPTAIKIQGQGTIARFNIVHDNVGDAIRTDVLPDMKNSINNHIYNNTLYDNGGPAWKGRRTGSSSETDARLLDHNVFMNNIVYRSRQQSGAEQVDVTLKPDPENTSDPLRSNKIHHNSIVKSTAGDALIAVGSSGTQSLTYWQATAPFNGDIFGNLEIVPVFVDSTPYEPEEFKLQSPSALIDAGDFLTRAVGTGSDSTTLVVLDAGFFSDGFGIVDGDLIRIGGGSPVEITAIDYDTQTITLAAPRTWANNAGVSLSYEGSAPDIGAWEYVPANDPPSVTLTAPTDTASYVLGESVALAATASDTDGIAQVDFFHGGATLIDDDATAPYTANWTPASVGGYSLTAVAYDLGTPMADATSAPVAITVVANSVPSITTTTLPGGATGTAYSQTLNATGGNGTRTWSLSTGNLPAGLGLSGTGVISGTPTTAGTTNFTVKVADADGLTGAADEDTQALSIAVTAPATTTFGVTHDAYLQSGTRYNNASLRTEAGYRVSYLQFDVTGLSGTVTDVKLRLTCAGDPGSGTIRVDKGNSNNWTETNLTTSNAPSSTGEVGSLNGTFALGTTYEWTLTGALTGNGTVSFIVTMDSGGNDAWFNSDEASVAANLKPQLVITTN